MGTGTRSGGQPHRSGVEIHGEVASGYQAAADAFAAKFAEAGEVGAAFSVNGDAQELLDMRVGGADPATGWLWEAGTAAVVYSTTEGEVAISEFAASWKDDVPGCC